MSADVIHLKPKRPEPVIDRFYCPCGSRLFTLWSDGHAHCGACGGHHHHILVIVDDKPGAA